MIRKANENDIISINKLGCIFNSNFVNTYNVIDYLKNKNYIILVNDEEEINGLIIVYKNIDYYELEAIVVDIESRKKGIATNLITYFIENYLTKNDEILLEVRVDNINAINLYKKFGFENISIRKKYYQNMDAFVMRKVI